MWYEIQPHCPTCDLDSPPHKLCVSGEGKIMIVAVCPACKKKFEAVHDFANMVAQIQAVVPKKSAVQ